jgi:hypothetical protein
MDRNMTDYAELLAQHNYAIVDIATVEPAPWHKELPLEPIVPHDLRGDADKMPALLPLTPGEPYMERLQSNLKDAESDPASHVLSCLLAIAPETSLSTVLWHLRSRLILKSPEGSALFRFYDSRVFVHLNRILNPERIRSLFGPIQTWTYRFQNQWHSATAPEINGIIPRLCSATTPQRRKLDRVILVNKVLKKWQRKLGRPWSGQEEYTAYAERTDQAMETASQTYQLHKAADLIDFAEHTLQYGTYFHRHPIIQGVLDEIKPKGNTGYSNLAGILNEQDWAAICCCLN